MTNDEIKRLRVLADVINESIIESTAVLAGAKNVGTEAMVARALADLRRAWAILDKRLRLNK